MTLLRVKVSRHSAFYSPVIGAMAAGFLREEGIEAEYSVLQPGERSHELIRAGAVDIMQSAVSSNWKPMEAGIADLPVHFAQINRRDGFFLVARKPEPGFQWVGLQGKTLLADHGLQPLVMLQFAARWNGLDWGEIRAADAGTPEEMAAAFRAGQGDYVHLQGPAAQQLEHEGGGHVVVSVGAAMPPVAFSSLCASRAFLETETARAFVRAYRRSRAWARETSAREVARVEQAFFPGIHEAALTAAIERYQQLGCWDQDIAIPRDLYDQALAVFRDHLTRAHAYEDVVTPPPE
ncbi:MAG TPA: ABC transporter substrate-binding protein [Bryobacteraceae bacterium]|nr:ABC transporter substrate-binding protein [Bryobacteraceae bacterium]